MLSVKQVKRIAVAIIGGTVLLIGLALVFLPGPAFVVVPAGLAILATEFEWARHWLHKTREYASRKFGRNSNKPADPGKESSKPVYERAPD
jgi:tellurite resistance protein TerC